jgi:dihydrodipicolinate synthase/N-acetylneuraminate lyase
MGADGWVAGLFAPFPKETVAIWKLVQVGRLDEAFAIYRWFGPWFDLDISTNPEHQACEVFYDRH